jgi:hypothetical protein
MRREALEILDFRFWILDWARMGCDALKHRSVAARLSLNCVGGGDKTPQQRYRLKWEGI